MRIESDDQDEDEGEALDEGLLEDARALGIDPQCLIDHGAAAKAAPEVFWLLPENLGAFNSFISVLTQWRCCVGPTGSMVRTGLDYGGADAALRRAGLRGRKLDERFADLRVMEIAALSEFNKAAT